MGPLKYVIAGFHCMPLILSSLFLVLASVVEQYLSHLVCWSSPWRVRLQRFWAVEPKGTMFCMARGNVRPFHLSVNFLL